MSLSMLNEYLESRAEQLKDLMQSADEEDRMQAMHRYMEVVKIQAVIEDISRMSAIQ